MFHPTTRTTIEWLGYPLDIDLSISIYIYIPVTEDDLFKTSLLKHRKNCALDNVPSLDSFFADAEKNAKISWT